MDQPPSNPSSLAVLCPGQGAQAVGMGKAWFDASPEARQVFDTADRVLGNRLGMPLTKLCFEGPAERLNQTDASQPAIFACSLASWAGLQAAWRYGPGEAPLAATAGLSLGEYTALVVGGAISFEDGLELVTLRGRAMQDAAEATPSGMIALIGADEAQAMEVCAQARGGDVLVCANFNAPGQIVISGSKAACERALPVATAMGLRATALAVAGAFHSPLMAPAAERLAAALATTTIKAARCPVLSNVTGVAHETADFAAGVRKALVQQLTHPVRWAQNCSWLAGNVLASSASNSNKPAEAHELAPGKTLAGLMRRIDKNVKVTAHEDPA
jgi:[acyl-carrier-protein] S-malonyltransferase